MNDVLVDKPLKLNPSVEIGVVVGFTKTHIN